MSEDRERRLSGKTTADDLRSPFQIDRDRILYSMHFRRLAGVTQVVSPGEGEIFHNRLTHTLKVAQIARRLAENLPKKYEQEIKGWGVVNPDVVEAAALAHDLGHPPFGHIGEETLNQLIIAELRAAEPTEEGRKKKEFEGYEGNAQSFRILAELAVRRSSTKDVRDFGLDLTVATLNATLKYPWPWGNPNKPDKYGVYKCDIGAFHDIRKSATIPSNVDRQARTLEAQIMDWADDIAYSVHDTEDFYRAGLIPLERMGGDSGESLYFLGKVTKRAEAENIKTDDFFKAIFKKLMKDLRVDEPYRGTKDQQKHIADFVSTYIENFITNTSILPPPGKGGEAVDYPDAVRLQVFFLKQLTWTYVIENPAFASHQLGQRRAIEKLFHEYSLAVQDQRWHLFPAFYRDRARELHQQHAVDDKMPPDQRVRLVADAISSMSDQQALAIYRQFSGFSFGSMLDQMVR